jgi:hypothetical protein
MGKKSTGEKNPHHVCVCVISWSKIHWGEFGGGCVCVVSWGKNSKEKKNHMWVCVWFRGAKSTGKKNPWEKKNHIHGGGCVCVWSLVPGSVVS